MPICKGCEQDKPLTYKKAQLCSSCYVQFKRKGTFERIRQPRGMCTAPGCDKVAHGRGLCHMHLKRLKVSGTLDDPRADNINLNSNQKLYAQWGTYRRTDGYPIIPEWRESFTAFMEGVGERPSLDHRLYRIDKAKPMGPGNFEWKKKMVTRVPGESDAEYNQRHRHARRAANGTAMWDGDLRLKYGQNFGLRELKAMAEKQGHLCAISGKPETAIRHGRPQHLTVDHNHKTGAVRQLLETRCNTGIGLLGDDIPTLIKAALYLAKHDPNGEGQAKIDAAIAYLQRHPVASLDKEGILPQS